jgi:hypothetical protein
MTRSRATRLAPALSAALALTLAACGGGDDDEAPSETTTPPGAGALPPSLLECFADNGFELESPNEIHSAPPDVVEECFNALHEGGG